MEDKDCPRCHTFGTREKVGWGVWYCHRCSHMWDEHTGALPLVKQESSDKPKPGKLKPQQEKDWPQL